MGDIAQFLLAADPIRKGKVPATDVMPTLRQVSPIERTLDPTSSLTNSGLRSGVTLAVTPSGRQYADTSASHAAVLTVVSGPDEGKEFPLPAGSSVIGRSVGRRAPNSAPTGST